MDIVYDVQKKEVVFRQIVQCVTNTRRRTYSRFEEESHKNIISNLSQGGKHQMIILEELSKTKDLIDAENLKLTNYLTKFSMDFQSYVNRSDIVISKLLDSIKILGKDYVEEIKVTLEQSEKIALLYTDIDV